VVSLCHEDTSRPCFGSSPGQGSGARSHNSVNKSVAFAGKPYSAASRTYLAVGVRIVTSSSAAVGCRAKVASKSALVAFIFTAIASLDDFGGGVADDVAAEHTVGGAVDHELHQHAGVAAGHKLAETSDRPFGFRITRRSVSICGKPCGV
jgi:hypothetical protein